MGWLRRLLRPRPRLTVAVDEGSGPVVVLVHGIASSAVTFENLVPLLTPSHRVVAVDLLGFGASPAPEDAEYTIDEHVAALHRTLRRLLGRRRFTLVGHSLGALMSARYAARSSRRLERLVLIAPPVYLPPESFSDPAARAQMGLYLRAYEFVRTRKDFTIRAAAQLAQILPIKDVFEVSERNWRAFTLSLQNSIEAQRTTISDIASVAVPVDLVYGTRDPFLMQPALRIVERLRGVSTHRIEGNDHLVRPRVAKTVAEILAEAPTRHEVGPAR